MTEQIEIIRSDRKTIAVEIKQDLRIIVRAPKGMEQADIRKFIDEKTPWIEKHMERLRERRARETDLPPLAAFTETEIKSLARQALDVIPPKVEKLAQTMGVTYGKITIRNQVSRWGSCSSKGNLNFNCLLMLCPDEVLDYVIVHELCHRKHMNHSRAFWTMVETYCPNYILRRNWLKENENTLIGRLRANGSSSRGPDMG